jgi:sec-independent protein translocase protein TatA
MFGLSGEHLLILAAILLIFGPRKLPELGSSISRAVRNFKDGLNGPPQPTETPEFLPTRQDFMPPQDVHAASVAKSPTPPSSSA